MQKTFLRSLLVATAISSLASPVFASKKDPFDDYIGDKGYHVPKQTSPFFTGYKGMFQDITERDAAILKLQQQLAEVDQEKNEGLRLLTAAKDEEVRKVQEALSELRQEHVLLAQKSSAFEKELDVSKKAHNLTKLTLKDVEDARKEQEALAQKYFSELEALKLQDQQLAEQLHETTENLAQAKLLEQGLTDTLREMTEKAKEQQKAAEEATRLHEEAKRALEAKTQEALALAEQLRVATESLLQAPKQNDVDKLAEDLRLAEDAKNQATKLAADHEEAARLAGEKAQEAERARQEVALKLQGATQGLEEESKRHEVTKQELEALNLQHEELKNLHHKASSEAQQFATSAHDLEQRVQELEAELKIAASFKEQAEQLALESATKDQETTKLKQAVLNQEVLLRQAEEAFAQQKATFDKQIFELQLKLAGYEGQANIGSSKAPSLSTVQAGPFDATLYLVNNFDVYQVALQLRKSPLDFAQTHYEGFGQEEGRSYTSKLPADFDVETYLELNSDLGEEAVKQGFDAKIFAMHHYLTAGANEGRVYKK